MGRGRGCSFLLQGREAIFLASAAAGTDGTKDEALSYRASLLPSSLAFWYTCS